MRGRCGVLGLLQVAVMMLVVAAAQADCPEPAPDPTGWWEWVETCFFNSPDCNRPGDGKHYPVQLHFTQDGLRETYYEEDLQFSSTYFVVCRGNWVVSATEFDGGDDIEIFGEPGSRRMDLTYQDVDGFTRSYVEREPIGTVPAAAVTWSALRADYR